VELTDGAPAVGRRCGGRECQGAGHAVRRRPASTVGCPPIRFPRPGSGCPTVRCPTVRCPTVRCPVSWFRRPGPTVRPAGVRPSARSPPRQCEPAWVRIPGRFSVSPTVAVGIMSGRRATLRPGRIGLQVVCGSERLGRRPESTWRGRCCGGGGRPVGERRSRTWPGRARAQAAARSTAGRWGRPAWRKGRRSLPANLGCGSAGPSATSCLWRGWHLAWSMTTLRGRYGA
jgi:hypothetical protein